MCTDRYNINKICKYKHVRILLYNINKICILQMCTGAIHNVNKICIRNMYKSMYMLNM